MNRRQFLRRAAFSGAGLLWYHCGRSALGAPAKDALRIALVGVGGRGQWFTSTIPRMGHNLVALCDVDDTRNPAAYEQLPSAKKYRDFRKMLDALHAEIDAVIVATPDHTHAVACAAAIRAGKHVFCEKPLTRTVHESRALRELARRHQVATSMGNQGTAAGPFRRALELIRQGAIGPIREVHVWNSEGGANRKEPPRDGGAAPDFLDWDLWLGPAEFRPYHRQWMQRNAWRDFGTCQLGNWGSHSANLAFRALQVDKLWLDPPAAPDRPLIRIQAAHSGVNRLSFPQWETVQWTLPARAGSPSIPFTWHNGRAPGSRELIEGLLGDDLDWGDKKDKKWADHGGALIVGARGRIHATAHNATFRLLPADQFQGVQVQRPESIEESRGHEQDWVIACHGGKPAWASFEYADALNEFLMLGNLATQIDPGTVLEFDPVAMSIVNHPGADALIRCQYRSGWTL
ncbi:MAG TPA: Gfo/Idh/MocA family oxidoreductase [Candidatus Paceibacterota bacterium]|nr:Gfo/Idh/MocA family oxidoreductase [Verrucomicrobiota bacterium]HOX03568.1 Gfo/Idh/MocA family oxidoreductase [Verrucomicrobiota bacterium]HRZ46457.1 Gfo/Idh/MocA family oxidoreductase [Candidatus Paceibacterota bacterium]HRZ91917.1 Gfo/Idh/MocA family oxidoreductase [Candidatus Paceibacterota bacterium]